jgi:leader peptidase (prepilin peptidase)/N-methyltransferase
MLTFLLIMMFVLGTILGSLLNVCIYRLPLEKSILWPGSRCNHCLQPIRWYDNIPLVSYVILGGRCRTCGKRYSARYFFIELFTGLCFVGLFYVEVIANIHQIEALAGERTRIEQLSFPSPTACVVFGHRALLLCLLLVASFCDLDYREIPFSITVPGTILGLIGATIWAWPWPYTPAQAIPEALQRNVWWLGHLGPKQGLYPWPFWGPLPAWAAPGGNWITGLATGIAGALAGTLMLRLIGYVFQKGLGREALGLGDADLMMMAGSFLGWQPAVVAFFIGVFVGLIVGLPQLLLRGDNMIPFGPSLAIGILVTSFYWHQIGPQVQPLFFNAFLIVPLVLISSVFLLIAAYLLRLFRIVRK